MNKNENLQLERKLNEIIEYNLEFTKSINEYVSDSLNDIEKRIERLEKIIEKILEEKIPKYSQGKIKIDTSYLEGDTNE